MAGGYHGAKIAGVVKRGKKEVKLLQQATSQTGCEEGDPRIHCVRMKACDALSLIVVAICSWSVRGELDLRRTDCGEQPGYSYT